MDDFFDNPFVLLLAFILVFIAIIVGLIAITESHACQEYARMGITVQFHFWTGCMAKHPVFGWMPTEQYFNSLNLNVPK